MMEKTKNAVTIAFLHIAPREGDIEYNNNLVFTAIKTAASAGAKLIVTPELATSGYTFAKLIGTDWIKTQPDYLMKRIMNFARRRELNIILGAPERDRATGLLYNSAFVISSDGKLHDFHRKLRIHPGLSYELWASPHDEIEPAEIIGHKIGVLVCADVWEIENVHPLVEKGAELLILPTNWPPDPCGPEDCWEKASKKYNIPLWVCNRTGSEIGMDFRRSESVVIVNGERVMVYAGYDSCVLLFDWDMDHMEPLSRGFKVLNLQKNFNKIQ